MLYLTLKLFFLVERKGDIGKAASYKTTAFFNAFRMVKVSSNSLFWMMINIVSGILIFIILILPSKIYF